MSPATRTRTLDGGVRQGGADLWCTYAAVRTLTWLGEAPVNPTACVRILRDCQNSDGGFAWQRGLPSDVWATYYCSQALRDLGEHVPNSGELARWLAQTQHSTGGFAMLPGQRPDVWATYYATRILQEILGCEPPNAPALRRWLERLQGAASGLGWYPGSAESDVRACYYGVMAWRAAFGDEPVPWTPALVDWIRARQTEPAGFTFADPDAEPCLWATFRATRALDALGCKPTRPEDCVAWISGRDVGPGFSRWDTYPTADVWACFSAVGALQTLGGTVPDPAGIVAFLRACELADGGFTYRAVESAGDCLATAAALLVDSTSEASEPGAAAAYTEWLERAHLPYEDGVMYMPGRGAEVRSTLWAVSALRASGHTTLDAERVAGWLRRNQNTDGGWGYWEGRASDMTATASAVEALAQLGQPMDLLNTRVLAEFVSSCRTSEGYRHIPGGPVTCAATAQALRVLDLSGDGASARRETHLLDSFVSRLGGFATRPRDVPDLVSTYQGVLTLQSLGLAVDQAGLDRFLEKVRLGDGSYAWSPLSRRPAGVLADALGSQLVRASTLHRLNL
jgi:hypothetical protein